jgi:hypothetical protein
MTGSDWPPSHLPSYPPPDGPGPLRGRVLDALLDEGYAPDVDADGDVAFVVREQRLFVRCVDGVHGGDGPGGVHGRVPLARVFGQWRISGSVPDDELVRLRACNTVTGRYELARASLQGDVLVVVADVVVPGEPDLRPLLTAASAVVLSAVRAWHAAAGSGSAGGGSAEGADGGAT